MIDKAKLNRDFKVIAQEAWSTEYNTTLNAMVEYICKHSFIKLLEAFEEELEEFKNEIRSLQEPKGNTDEIPKESIRQSRLRTKAQNANL